MSLNEPSLESYGRRVRNWAEDNLASKKSSEDPPGDREVLRRMFEGGFSGIAVPKAYGGAGLTLEHQRVWAQETKDYWTPQSNPYRVTLGMLMPTLLEHASEEVKRRHIPRMLRGDELWIQLLSEPSGGSDLAGCLTRATAEGDRWILNGSKMWSSHAMSADFGLCLARSDWDAPKHHGLTMFAMSLKAEGVSITPILLANGGHTESCLEFLDNVVVEPAYVVGESGQGWTVARTLLLHEREAVAGIGFGMGLGGDMPGGEHLFSPVDLLSVLAERESGDPVLQNLVARDYVEETVLHQLSQRLNTGMRSGAIRGQWGSLHKLGAGMNAPAYAERALAAAGCDGVIWSGDGQGVDSIGARWLVSRIMSIGGGTNEMQRNIIAERLLGLPREPDDREQPFRGSRGS